MAKKKQKDPDKPIITVDRAIFDIDKNNLDEEWVNQPKLSANYSEKLADARLNLDEMKVRLDVISAELDVDIRENPEEYGLEKITEAAVKAAIQGHERYLKQVRRISKAKHLVDLLSGYVNALEHRKRALEKLVDLFQLSYFAAPRKTKRGREA